MLILGLTSFFLVEKFMSMFGIAAHSHEDHKENEELIPDATGKNNMKLEKIKSQENNITDENNQSPIKMEHLQI